MLDSEESFVLRWSRESLRVKVLTVLGRILLADSIAVKIAAVCSSSSIFMSCLVSWPDFSSSSPIEASPKVFEG